MAIGPNHAAMIPAYKHAQLGGGSGGCGMPHQTQGATEAMSAGGGGLNFASMFPQVGMAGIGMADMAALGEPERFAMAYSGGVILDKEGVPAGRIPEQSFIDLESGKLYGPDAKEITLPEGASVDFFDLPDIKQLQQAYTDQRAAAAAGTTEGGGAAEVPTKVAGASGGGTDDAAPTKVAGASGSGASEAPTKVAGASGGGVTEAAPAKNPATAMWGPGGVTPLKGGGGHVGCDMHGTLVSNPGQSTAGGLLTAVGGANGVGQMPSLEAALAELMLVLQQLTMAVQGMQAGGGPGQAPPTKTPDEAPSKEPVIATPAESKPAETTPSTETDVAGATGSGSDTSSSETATGTAPSTDTDASSEAAAASAKKDAEPAASVEADTSATASDASSSDA